jgi:chromosome partitioning protein
VPVKLTIANQRGGVAKTTTACAMARCLADMGKKVLLVDADAQGSIAAILGLRPELHLYDFLIGKLRLSECITPAHERIDVICSNRQTTEAEAIIQAQTLREMVFETLFSPYDHLYDAVLIDVAPSITLFQTCAMMYSRRVLIPVGMEPLSFQGATASINATETLTRLFRTGVQCLALLPVMVNRRLALTETITGMLEMLAEEKKIPLLPAIRTDAAIAKSMKAKKFLADYDSRSKALEDYTEATRQVLALLEAADAATFQQTA